MQREKYPSKQTSTLVLLWVEYLDYWIRSGTVSLVMPGIILLPVCILEISYLQVYLFLAAVQGGDDIGEVVRQLHGIKRTKEPCIVEN